MIRKISSSLKAIILLCKQVALFHPQEVFRNKRVAIIGAAATAFEEENGEFINSFDIVVRVNKALHKWEAGHEKYIGKRTDVLFHSFYENEYSGGGPIDYEGFVRKFGLQYLVHSDNSWKGLRTHLNFYRRHPENIPTYLLSSTIRRSMHREFETHIPTVGFAALYSVLNSSCKEVFITGFTFFQTPYANGYRDQFIDKESNDRHIDMQGLHNPELELKIFINQLRNSNCQNIICDRGLNQLLSNF